ncbi:MAG TPA: rRNA maturation RNase YbeY [Vicinamibacterales bacterium]|nr:rRNA maturation RNase YbeY [Vicinamibacterales bacterium]
MAVTDARGRATAAGGLGPWLERAAPAKARGVVVVALVSDETMRRLNRHYRGLDTATDVLSFPADPTPGTGSARLLGDLAIATGVAARQARQEGHSRSQELRILALHGLLHLLGYDHETDLGDMTRLEERLRRRAGLPIGLIGRARRAGPR